MTVRCQQFHSMRVFIEVGGPHPEIPHWHIGESPGKHGFLVPCYAPLVAPTEKRSRAARDDKESARDQAERAETPLPIVGGVLP